MTKEEFIRSMISELRAKLDPNNTSPRGLLDGIELWLDGVHDERLYQCCAAAASGASLVHNYRRDEPDELRYTATAQILFFLFGMTKLRNCFGEDALKDADFRELKKRLS